ncbi:prolipoprotein diacylglyceryl transferase [Leeia sp. TBRC 13508]|uniref:Phosphatidylglycerol--prolipoprotein diacylglyceryl transferase n=1 Tax=Leeia speluncae TaxID=2884804 RepID=A0ABS8D7J0_9NEIS|nr:prolipoprotein diacylglyceryl transferase [Leeia speluncae]MCB6184003.1 prolipoprotein diacylglyceryl transferase [Leeia speluncae]
MALQFADLHLSPVAFNIPLIHWPVHWYGLMYMIGFILFLVLGRVKLKQRPDLGWKPQDLDDLLFYGALGVILGGRIGYILFYQFSDYLHNPLDIFKLWQGGMSFHGGLIGVILAMVLFAKKKGVTWITVTDFIAPTVPIGLMVGRIGNFINGELWGRVTSPDSFWAVVFPGAQAEDLAYLKLHPEIQNTFIQLGGLPRHPSQLYQALLEGFLLFVILWVYSKEKRATGAISGLFLLGYGAFRFIAEFAREPDSFLGYLALHLSMGQWLCLPMIVIGAWMFAVSKNSRRR